MNAPEFKPGFRISWRDIAVLAAGCVASTVSWAGHPTASIVIGLAVGHFFLFCNVFRIARNLELVWVAIFCVLVASSAATGTPSLGAAMIASVAWAAISIAIEMSKPSYHGVGWQRINPGLPGWWERRSPGRGAEEKVTGDTAITGRVRIERSAPAKAGTLIAEFEGVLGYGSSGNAQVDYIKSTLAAAVQAESPAAVILDLSRVRYTFGNHALLLLLNLRTDHRRTVLVISDQCEQLGIFTQHTTKIRVARSATEALEMLGPN